MTRSQQDVENLFASQGIAGRYRELAKHPAPSAAKAQEASADRSRASDASSSATSATAETSTTQDAALRFTGPQQEGSTPPPRRGMPRLGLVMPAPGYGAQPVASRPLSELFLQLTQGAGAGTQHGAAPGTADSHDAEARQPDPLRHLRLPALFAHLERSGKRR